VDVLVVVGPADVREGRIDLQLHLGAVSRLALVQDGDSNDGFLSVANLKFAVLFVTTGDLDKCLKLKSRSWKLLLSFLYFSLNKHWEKSFARCLTVVSIATCDLWIVSFCNLKA
jgi:hypothetical protein